MILLHVVLLTVLIPWSLGCDLKPDPHYTRVPKSPGDNHYKIIVGDNPERYVPGKRYLVALVGRRTHSTVQQFTRFKITAEPLNPLARRSPQYQGNFLLFGDRMTQFDESCVNSIVEADNLPKNEVNVMWTAPKAGSGCVLIKGMVYEDENTWYAEDGQMTKTLCEDKSTVTSDCCACDDAKYSMVFEGIWSKETHPKDYPTQSYLIHFSDIIGATHGDQFSFWGEGKIASDGVRSLAEWGSIDLLERELKQEAPKLRSLVKAPGLFYPTVNGNTSTSFSVDRKRNLVSFVSMFGPSPDWIVGVNGLDLCTRDCSWVEEKVVDLEPYDAGTDNGITYMSPNSETMPHEKIYKITPMYPEDPRSPFYDPSNTSIPPIARVYLKREKLISKSCSDDVLQQLILDTGDESPNANKDECKVSDWGPWGPCSVSCGKGIRARTRQYMNKEMALMSKCERQLVGKEMCAGPMAECPDSPDLKEEQSVIAERVADEVCLTSPWSDWSECSCETGTSVRRRRFLRHEGTKKCPLVKTEETKPCEKPDECAKLIDPECPTTEWSDWSPCSTTCGPGVQMRMRLLLVPKQKKPACARRVTLTEHQECVEKERCSVDLMTAKRICMQEPDVGLCRGSFNRWAFISMKGMCVPFVYSGCKGNENNFDTQEECLATCKVVADALGIGGSNPNPDLFAQLVGTEAPPAVNPMDCLVSEWSDWSPCDVGGHQIKTRTILA